MKTPKVLIVSLVILLSFLVIGAGARKPVAEKSAGSAQVSTPPSVSSAQSVAPAPTLRTPDVTATVPSSASAAASYNLDWWSINGGGDVAVSSANYQLGLSVGQSAASAVSSANYGMGIGFWYGAAGASAACPISMTGDVNTNGSITSSDIIYLVGYVFKGGAAPMPCPAAGDVNCNGSVTSSDIIYLVGYVFKGGPAPCDACTLIPGTWSCP